MVHGTIYEKMSPPSPTEVHKYWPAVHVNKSDTELAMFSKYYDIIDKRTVKIQIHEFCKYDFEKNALQAEEIRQEGNKLYKRKDYDQSLSKFNESISFAPVDSKEFALAVANRSTVHFRKGKFKECLQDIQIILKSKYPEDLLYKIFLRQAECFLKLKLRSEAKESLRKAKECVDKFEQPESPETMINSKFMDIKYRLKERFASIESEDRIDDYVFEEPSLTNGENPKFLNASQLVHFQNSANFGRYVIAKSDIKRGDVLFIEEPYAHIYHASNFSKEKEIKYTYCAFCLHRTLNYVPCSMCPNYFYCSEKCRENDWDMTHRWKCRGERCNMIAHPNQNLCLNVLFAASRNGFKTEIEDPSVYGSRENNHPFLNKLLTHINDMQEEDLEIFIQYAVWIVLYLEYCTDYFDWLQEHLPGTKRYQIDLIKLVGGKILHYLLQIDSNFCDIMKHKIYFHPEKLVCVRQYSVGMAIYVSASLLNHSCVPNTIKSFDGTKLVIRAAEDIRKGTEVTTRYLAKEYGEYRYHFERRQELLHYYKFNCKCQVCVTPNYVLESCPFLCKRCNGKAFRLQYKAVAECTECYFRFDLAPYNLNTQKIEDRFQIFLMNDDFNQLNLILHFMRLTYHSSNQQFLRYYRGCLWYHFKNGNMKESFDAALKLLESTENVFEDVCKDYILNILSCAFIAVTYAKSLRQEKSPNFREYFNEAKEMVKRSTRVMEYNTSPATIGKFVDDLNDFLNDDNYFTSGNTNITISYEIQILNTILYYFQSSLRLPFD